MSDKKLIGIGTLGRKQEVLVSDTSNAVTLSGVITPSTITSNQNDYNPTGLSTASTLRLATDASRNITGIAGGVAGRLLLIYNVGANGLYLKNEDAGSSAANRFSLGQSIDVSIAPNSVAILSYDGTSSRWRSIIAGPKSWAAVPTLQNSWVNYGFGLRDAEYMKDAFGRVWVRGNIKSGSTSSGVLLWTFGSGYLPTNREIFLVMSPSGAAARIDVLTDGTVLGYGLNSSEVFLNFSYSTLG